jgi:hypothetical protein
MKRLIAIITIVILITMPSFSQKEEEIKKLENLENKSESELVKDSADFEIGDKLFSVRDMGNETRINVGKREFRVVEDNDGVTVFRSTRDDNNRNNRGNRFQGHLGGMEFGFNGYLTDFWNTSLDPEDYYFDLNTAKSNCWNFMLPNVNIGISRHLGFAAGLGLNFNKYRFDGNNSIIKDENGVIGPLYPDPDISYSKTKLVTTYAILPLILEAQIPVSHGNTINIGAGLIGAVKLGSHTKVVYYNDGKQKEKNRDDFSLNILRYGTTVRLGYDFVQLFGTCYLTPLFEKGKGPELYPFEVGIALTFND